MVKTKKKATKLERVKAVHAKVKVEKKPARTPVATVSEDGPTLVMEPRAPTLTSTETQAATLSRRQVAAHKPLPDNTKWTKNPPGKLLVACGWGSLEALREKTGYTVHHLRYMLLGRRMPTAEALLRIKDATGIDGDRLLESFRQFVMARLADNGENLTSRG